MDFMKLLQSLDELLYEIMSWLVFFPLTLWRTITRPLQMMAYADRELHDAEENQYEDTLSPPLFLLASLLIAHGIELAMGAGSNPLVTKQTGLASLIDDETSLLMLRLAIFSLIPMMLAVCLVTGRKLVLTRDRLRAPFYSQCYPAAPFALLIGIGTILAASPHGTRSLIGATIVISALVAYFVLQIVWFRRRLSTGIIHATARVTLGFAGALVVATVIFVLLA